jgi:hypothetical protein
MNTRLLLSISAMLVVCVGTLSANPHRERALWVEVSENGDRKTTIAVTEDVARVLLESERLACCLSKNNEEQLITREMLRAVLDGDEESIEIQNEEGSEVKLYMASLKVPGEGDENGKLILETYRDGSRTFRMSLPEIEIEASDEDDCDNASFEMNIGWKGFLPFLAKEGGAIYVDSQDDNTEVWIYVD